jgi:hypothetical protein
MLRQRVFLWVGTNLSVERQSSSAGQYLDIWSIANIYQSTACLVPEDRAVHKTVHHLEPYKLLSGSFAFFMALSICQI